MKKQFLTLALLATVAVGGAFAGSNHKKVLAVPAGTLTSAPVTLPDFEPVCWREFKFIISVQINPTFFKLD